MQALHIGGNNLNDEAIDALKEYLNGRTEVLICLNLENNKFTKKIKGLIAFNKVANIDLSKNEIPIRILKSLSNHTFESFILTDLNFASQKLLPV